MNDLDAVQVDLPKNQPTPHEEHAWGNWYPYMSTGKEYRMCTLPYCREMEIV